MTLLLCAYWFCILGLFLYGLNCYFLLGVFLSRKRGAMAAIRSDRVRFRSQMKQWPRVAVQLPIYNERYVVKRLIEAACRLDYPREQLEIQVLDDSDDETTQIIAASIAEYQKQGFQIQHVRRNNREGFKAGALKYGMEQTAAEFIAIFDADFVPRTDFLQKTVPFFVDPKVGLVQTRWSHLNRNYSLLTKCQAIAIDGHFSIEQASREWGGYYLNFNGTAGIWRKKAIEDAGGWQGDTLTEDLDLSYRAQMEHWGVRYLPDVDVPAEIPIDIAAFKSQQRRWAKGSIQTAMKLLPRVWREPLPWMTRIQSTLHLTHYLIHPLMLAIAVLSLPVLTWWEGNWTPVSKGLIVVLLVVGTLSTSSLYIGSQQFLYSDWYKRILYIPILMFVGTGIALSNTLAVVEALIGVKTPFVRTPKWNLKHHEGVEILQSLKYRIPNGRIVLLEAFLFLYCLFTLISVATSKRFIISPFLFIYTMGFGFVVFRAIRDTLPLSFSKQAPDPVS